MMQAEIIIYTDGRNYTLSLSPVQLQAIVKLLGLHKKEGVLVSYSDEILQQLVEKTLDKWKVVEKVSE